MYSFIITSAYVGFIIVTTALSYYLGRTKTEHPLAAGAVGFLLSLLPPLALIYLAVLVFKDDAGTV